MINICVENKTFITFIECIFFETQMRIHKWWYFGCKESDKSAHPNGREMERCTSIAQHRYIMNGHVNSQRWFYTIRTKHDRCIESQISLNNVVQIREYRYSLWAVVIPHLIQPNILLIYHKKVKLESFDSECRNGNSFRRFYELNHFHQPCVCNKTIYFYFSNCSC